MSKLMRIQHKQRYWRFVDICHKNELMHWTNKHLTIYSFGHSEHSNTESSTDPFHCWLSPKAS